MMPLAPELLPDVDAVEPSSLLSTSCSLTLEDVWPEEAFQAVLCSNTERSFRFNALNTCQKKKLEKQ
jgi:hypothetical protein